MNDPNSILAEAYAWRQAGHTVALATVVKTWGSSPCPVGSKLAVRDGVGMIGSVSGGCVEGAVVEASLGVVETGKPQLLKFGVSDEDAWSVGLACGGEVAIFVEPLA